MKIVRLFSGSDQKSHFEEIELKFAGNQPMLKHRNARRHRRGLSFSAGRTLLGTPSGAAAPIPRHPALLAFPEWQGAKLLAACGQHTYWFLVIRSDLKPQRGDLSIVKGLRIGAAPGVNLSLQRMLVEAGIDPEKNHVQIMPIPGAAGPSVSFGLSAAKALEEGTLDGFWANGMGCEVAVRRGVGTMVLDVRRGDGPTVARHYTFSALVATDKTIKDDPAAARAAIRAMMKAHKALKQDPNRATAVGQKRFPPSEAELIAELVRRDTALLRSDYPTGKGREHEPLRPGYRPAQGSGNLRPVVARQFSHLWNEAV